MRVKGADKYTEEYKNGRRNPKNNSRRIKNG